MRKLSLFMFALLAIMLFFAGATWSNTAPIVPGEEIAFIGLSPPCHEIFMANYNFDSSVDFTILVSAIDISYEKPIIAASQESSKTISRAARDHILV